MTPLPERLPANPLPLLGQWIEEASAATRNPTAMTLATVEPDGRPSARMVICRGFDLRAGWFVFYTDRESPKGRALEAHPEAALVFHWDPFQRQIRIEGPTTRVPKADSDAYWSTRPSGARIAAFASRQSQPLASRAELLEAMESTARRFASQEIPRPERWGGYRVWAESVELWVGQPSRAHDRCRHPRGSRRSCSLRSRRPDR